MFLYWEKPKNEDIANIVSYEITGDVTKSIPPEWKWGTYFVCSGLTPWSTVTVNMTVKYKHKADSAPVKLKFNVPEASELIFLIRLMIFMSRLALRLS